MRSNVSVCSFWGILVILALVSVCHAEVAFRILKADGVTPFDGRPIMVGTQLQIIVSSDAPMFNFGGGLFLKDIDRYKADFINAATLPACGRPSYIFDDSAGDLYEGCEFYAGTSAQAGDLFIVDYVALEAGDCNVGIYEEDGMGGFALIGSEYQFSHVKTRDFSGDGQVDFADFAKFAAYWQTSVCIDECRSYDLDDNGVIDNVDVALFTEYWLERTF